MMYLYINGGIERDTVLYVRVQGTIKESLLGTMYIYVPVHTCTCVYLCIDTDIYKNSCC